MDNYLGAARHLGWIFAVLAGMAVLVALLLLPGILAADTAVSAVEDEWFDIPALPDEIEALAQSSFVYDRDAERIAELHGPVQRVLASLDEIADHAVSAVLATEDVRYFEHDGVDHDAIARAMLRNLAAGDIVEGASTITQQLVRQALMDPADATEQTLERKAHEAVWAVELEERLGKEQILEAYLNTIYFGQGVYGIATASRHYFSKHPSHLTLAEAATLAGAIRAPNAANPVVDPEAAQLRRDIVVQQMLNHGFITQEEADEVLGTDLELDLYEPGEGEPFWEDLVRRLLYDPRVDLQPGLQEAIGETVEERIEMIFAGGLQIRTTLDADMQRLAAETVRNYVDDPVEDPLGSIISADHTTGAVRAIALGPKAYGECPEDEEPCPTTNVNPAVPGIGGSGRQAGSAFKPFVSAAALERGFDTGESYDTPSGEEVEDCGPPWDPYEPHNYDRSSAGHIAMSEAMGRSVNVYFVKLARDVGVPAVVETALEHGFTGSPNLRDFGERMCSLALGTADVFPLEMVTGYGAWANDGVRCEPYLIERIRDRDGELIYEHEPRCERVVSSTTARQMRSLLRAPVQGGGTAWAVGAQVGGDVFGKTGTTNNHVDAWFVGTAHGHTTAAWLGYETPQPMEGVTIRGTTYRVVAGGTIPAPMWAEYKSQLE